MSEAFDPPADSVASRPLPPGMAWPEGRFEGRTQFREVLLAGLACAAAQGSRTLWLSDTDFADWPLSERIFVGALDAWCSRTRASPVAQVRVMAQSFGDMRQRHPRFVQWRGLWIHRVQTRATAQGADGVPSVLWTPEWMLHRIDPLRDTVVATTEPASRILMAERLQQWWQQARPAFADTTLGL